MRTTQILAELLVVGILTIFGLSYMFDYSPILDPLEFGFTFKTFYLITLAYVIGYFINVISEIAIRPLTKILDNHWIKKYAHPSIVMDEIRYKLYTGAPLQVINRMEYHRSFLRLARCIALLSSILCIMSLIRLNNLITAITIPFFFLSLFAYSRRLRWLNKSVYLSWKALKESSQKLKYDTILKSTFPSDKLKNKDDRNFLVFAGGTGFREINRTVVDNLTNITRVVPVFDNGGSSKILRKNFNVLPIGDVRNALITMAPHSGPIRKIVKLFNWRLPKKEKETNEALIEFDKILEGTHILIDKIDFNLKGIIIGYLKRFKDSIPDNFDFKNGSIGNFILIGAWLAHNEDINAAIFVFRHLCNIEGDVIPISLEFDLHLGAILKDKERNKETELLNNKKVIYGQEKITTLPRKPEPDSAVQPEKRLIDSIFICNTNDIKNEIVPKDPLVIKPNPAVIEKIRSSEIIIYGPGSFFTSILPHFMINSIVDEIADRKEIPKVFIANLTESSETYGYTLDQLLHKLFDVIRKNESEKRQWNEYITHILINQNPDNESIYESGRKYLKIELQEDMKKKNKIHFHEDSEKKLDEFWDAGIEIIEADLEDPWRRGLYDPKFLSNILLNIKN